LCFDELFIMIGVIMSRILLRAQGGGSIGTSFSTLRSSFIQKQSKTWMNSPSSSSSSSPSLFSTSHTYNHSISNLQLPFRNNLSSSASHVLSTPTKSTSIKSFIRDYLVLSKHKLSALVTFTAGVGYALRCEIPFHENEYVLSHSEFCSCKVCTFGLNRVHALLSTVKSEIQTVIAVLVGTFLASACANTLNQVYERFSDAKMIRTRIRPLPAGRLTVPHALFFAATTFVASMQILNEAGGSACALLGALNVVLYAGVYTPLKAIHPVNTLVGAVVGAIPPLMGYAAASWANLRRKADDVLVTKPLLLQQLSDLCGDGRAAILGAWLLLWQIPHFNALAYVIRSDYAAGGIRMLAVSSPVLNARLALLVSAAMLPLGLAAEYSGLCSSPFGFIATGLTSWMTWKAVDFARNPESLREARALFRTSIIYLPLLLTVMMYFRRIPVLEEQQKLYAEAESQRRKQRMECDRLYGLAGRELIFSDSDPSRQIVYRMPAHASFAPFPFLPPPAIPDAVYERRSVS